MKTDDEVICTHHFSNIHPVLLEYRLIVRIIVINFVLQMDNGEIMINLLEHRPNRYNFTSSTLLQVFRQLVELICSFEQVLVYWSLKSHSKGGPLEILKYC